LPRTSLLGVSVSNEIEDLRDNAERFSRLAWVVADERNGRLLFEMADRLDEIAERLQKPRPED
jgi:hypothetical protein